MSRFGDKCNVTRCNELHDGIPHLDTGLKYCYFCAKEINRYNPDRHPFTQESIKEGLKVRRERDV